MPAYYNEHDPFAAQWLRNLIDAGEIAPGVVDERDIQNVTEDDLEGFTQVHLFAGIGGWSRALRLAGWNDDDAVWTCSCPCQPFSQAGKRKGKSDERHLWPHAYRLIDKRRPAKLFGEQVAGPDGLAWLDGVFADLEASGYACAAADLCAAGIDAPQIRQRLYWVADANRDRFGTSRDGLGSCHLETSERGESFIDSQRNGDARGLAVTEGEQPHGNRNTRGRRGEFADDRRTCRTCDGRGYGLANFSDNGFSQCPACGGTGRLGDADDAGLQGRGTLPERTGERSAWTPSVAVPCLDGKSRRVEPGSFPLVDGIPSRVGPLLAALRPVGKGAIKAARSNRVGRLKGYGNAIVPELAAEFICACQEVA